MDLNIHISGQGLPLVLFHGWGFDNVIWSPLAAAMEQRFTIYAVDLPGFGQTPMMSWTAFKSQLLARLPAQFVLAGWSLGGLYATRLALEAPSRVTHLINIASSPRFVKDEQWPGIEPKVLDTFYSKLIIDPIQVRKEFIALQTRNESESITAGSTPSPAGLRGGLDVLAQWDFRSQLPLLQHPVCFMFGKLDSIIPRATYMVMKEDYPEFHYVLFPKAAHMPFMTHQAEFITQLDSFLKVQS